MPPQPSSDTNRDATDQEDSASRNNAESSNTRMHDMSDTSEDEDNATPTQDYE
ncbi:hypothetical protein HDU98_009961, partial [Podochytrium sp. JEL0797]